MRFLYLTLLVCFLNVFSFDPALKSSTKILKPITANPTITHRVKPEATSIIFQSTDGGQTWQDISSGLPRKEQLGGFFAGASDLYLHVKNVLYRSKSNLETPVWEKENVPDLRLKNAPAWPTTSIAFNPSGVMVYTYPGQIYQRIPATETWLPIHTNFKKNAMRTILETSDGTIFLGYDHGLYKSIDKGKNWKQVQKGSVMDLVQSEGVLLGAGQNGILRSTDNGEHWESVISEGDVGFAVERIDGGFAAISYSNITKSRRIRISLDNGTTWKAIDEGLPPSPSISSIKQIGNYLICGHPDGIFRSSDMGKTWNIVHPGVNAVWNLDSGPDKRVFKIYASGNVLYAVAVHFGC